MIESLLTFLCCVIYVIGFVVGARATIRWIWDEFPLESDKVSPGTAFIAIVFGLIWPLIGLFKLAGWILSYKMKS